MVDTTYMTPKEVAELLSIHEETLRRWRAEGEGPPWHKLSDRVIRYDRGELEAWLEQQKDTEVK